MNTGWSSFSCFQSTEEDEARALALQAEARVRLLGSLPAMSPSPTDDTVAILKSTCLLLDRLVEQQSLVQQEPVTQQAEDYVSPGASQASAFPTEPEVEVISPAENLTERSPEPEFLEIKPEPLVAQQEVEIVFLEETVPERSSEPELEFDIEPEPEPSLTARELIKLRDHLLLANPEDISATQTILKYLYQKLGQILAEEGIVSLEEIGAFNYQYQQVIATQATNDPALDEMICSTVRTGYLFHQKLLRPQEVITYTYLGSSESGY